MMGELGKGYKYAIETLNTGRIGIAAQVSEYLSGSQSVILIQIDCLSQTHSLTKVLFKHFLRL